ncbi:MAG: tetratricopeptide repeat protein [Clostridia bacterium]|nr:tetratricopeptide repeat protein [Clostridia bacterium]
MEKIIKLNNDADFYYDRGIKNSEAGNFVDAISDFHASLSRNPKNPLVYSELGYCYTALGQEETALHYYHLLHDTDRDADVGYLGLIQCYSNLNNMPAALFYLNEGIERDALDDGYDFSSLIDEAKEMRDESRKLRLVKREDYSETLALGKSMIMSGEYGMAKRVLEEVPQDNELFVDANNALAYIEFTLDNYSTASQIVDRSLEKKPDDIVALNTKLYCQTRGGDEKGANETAEILSKLNPDDDNELYAIALALLNSGFESKAKPLLEKVNENRPCTRDCMLALAQIYYNEKDYDRAQDTALKLRKVYPEDRVVSYYARLIKGGQEEYIFPSPELPSAERERRIKLIDQTFSELSDINKVVRRLGQDEELEDAVKWLIDSAEESIGAGVGAFLAQSPKWQPYIYSKLVAPNYSHNLKREFLESYLNHSQSKRFSVLAGFVQTFHYPRKPKVNDTVTMQQAYWRAYATAAFTAIDFSSKINKVYKQFVETMSKPDFVPFQIDISVMSALLCYTAKIGRNFASVKTVCRIFEIKEEDFRAYALKLGVDLGSSDPVDDITKELGEFIERALVDEKSESDDEELGTLADLIGEEFSKEDNPDDNE